MLVRGGVLAGAMLQLLARAQVVSGRIAIECSCASAPPVWTATLFDAHGRALATASAADLPAALLLILGRLGA